MEDLNQEKYQTQTDSHGLTQPETIHWHSMNNISSEAPELISRQAVSWVYTALQLDGLLIS